MAVSWQLAAQAGTGMADHKQTMFRRWLLRGLFALWLLPAATGSAAPLLLDGRDAVPAWPAVTLLSDPGHALDVEQVLQRLQDFRPPTGTVSNLGRVADTMWLRIPLHVPGIAPVQRVLEIDYPALNRVDLYLVQQGRVLQHERMGNALRFAERPLPARTHAVALALAPGDHELLLQVQTRSSMMLPITLRTAASFTAQESRAQLLQGVIAGLALCMLIYSLAHWFSLRDRLFLQYALLLGGNGVFLLSYFGIGAQYLWPDAPALSQQIAPLAVLLAVSAGTGFLRVTLVVHEISRLADLLIRGIGMAAMASLALGVLGLLDYPALQSLATLLGLLSTAVVLPVAFGRARLGERVAIYMLFGWAFYVIGAVIMTGLLRGYIEPSFATQYFYPLAMMIEMSAWMAVLGERVHSIHRNADRARVESETLRALAHTDALTGLPNRRGLETELAAALAQADHQRVLAVYLLDLDGFKAVNDRLGHDTGDELLVAVSARLKAELRHSDVVARLGGDEFVVLARGLGAEADAWQLGRKLVAAFGQPFTVRGQSCSVGLTAGFALAPLDGHDASSLLRRADAAMYAGKQSGKGTVRRGAASAGLAAV